MGTTRSSTFCSSTCQDECAAQFASQFPDHAFQSRYNPLLVSDNMHLVQALLDAADESDFTAVDDLGRHTIWSFMDLAVDDLIMFQYYRPVLVALFDHRFVTPALLNAHDYYKITMLHQVMNEIRYGYPWTNCHWIRSSRRATGFHRKSPAVSSSCSIWSTCC